MILKEGIMDNRPNPARIGKGCVACGRCVNECPMSAISIHKGTRAVIDEEKCVGCGRCAAGCPADVIQCDRAVMAAKTRKTKSSWYDYLWIFSTVYLALGFFNILFAWIGLICFITPLLISLFGGGKAYCNKYCGRGQLFELLGARFGLSRKKSPPRFLRSPWFRYGFLTFFMVMFLLMIYNTRLVFSGATLKQVVTLLWVFKLPWSWAYTARVAPWAAQFAFGFYGVMLTSTVLGLITMALFRPRSWCVYCPMGTMTQGICILKNRWQKNM